MNKDDWKSLLEEMIDRVEERMEQPQEPVEERHGRYQLEQLQLIYERDFEKRYEGR